MSSNGSLPLSPTANTVTTATQIPGEPSEANLKFLMTTSTIKIGAVTFFFFGLWPDTTPPPDPWFEILVLPPPWGVWNLMHQMSNTLVA